MTDPVAIVAVFGVLFLILLLIGCALVWLSVDSQRRP